MIRIVTVILVLTVALMSLNNSKVNPNDPAGLQDSERPVDPYKVPEERILYKFVPIISLEFKITDKGIDLIKRTRRMGVKSHSLALDRDIKIKALSSNSEVLKVYSVNDPRHVHSVDGKVENHSDAHVESGVFRVNIEDPENVKTIRIEATTETLKNYQREFRL